VVKHLNGRQSFIVSTINLISLITILLYFLFSRSSAIRFMFPHRLHGILVTPPAPGLI